MRSNADLIEAVTAWAGDRLGEPLDALTLARRAGYSLHHFSRLFSAHTGEGPAEWIERNRIALAQRLLLETRQKIIDVALTCGFNEAATFTRAFRRRLGLTPSRFRTSRLAAYRESPRKPVVPMGLVASYGLEDAPTFSLCGLVTEVRSEPDAPAHLWAELMEELSARGVARQNLDFRQVAFWTEDAETRFTCVAGFIATRAQTLPLPFASVRVPAARCLVFDVPGPPDRIAEAYAEIYGSILPSLTWRPDQGFAYERYPAQGHTQILLPVSPGAPGEAGDSAIA